MITKDTISRHELIGLETQVVESNNSQLVGLNGRVINETKSMITINTKKGKKMIPKLTSNLKFFVKGENILVKGSSITKRPFERIGAKA
ncbi:ribonuclease P protein subunit [Nitrosopumilus sp. Nsub]|uniref:ribonuclease P protein component 1 n=1 Tax=Nitrosopumilus sp. Nsub TaxID=1776294 RepID=UPI000834B7F3|nr:ribonuclease P protein subunit [Nitrosopumilus sp. Nsub]